MNASLELRERLRQRRNADGGWGYFAGKSSRLEPTAWGVLALTLTGELSASRALQNWPWQEGVLTERAGGASNYSFHGFALLVMRACNIDHSAGTPSLLAALERAKGVKLEPSAAIGHQDNNLQGWSWISETFSWVEPTAWCMLCLKKWIETPRRGVEAARLNEAERMLINRMCADGGWNYGNAEVLGKSLRPYVPTTAVGLLAMQDRRDLDVVGRSIDYLEAHGSSERSATALALALIALRVYGRPSDGVRSALLAQIPTTLELGNLAAIAMAACALEIDQVYGAFTL
jgi:hypothetical protein